MIDDDEDEELNDDVDDFGEISKQEMDAVWRYNNRYSFSDII